MVQVIVVVIVSEFLCIFRYEISVDVTKFVLIFSECCWLHLAVCVMHLPDVCLSVCLLVLYNAVPQMAGNF